jgi:hypothetical protein
MSNNFQVFSSVFTIIVIITITISSVVLGTMSLAFGVNMQYNTDVLNCTNGDYQFKPANMYIWLIVYGSFCWASVGITCLFSGFKETDENVINVNPCKIIHYQIGFVAFCWVIYGAVQIFNDDIYNSLYYCDEWGTYLMYVICMYSIILNSVFLPMLILIICIMACGMCKVFAD